MYFKKYIYFLCSFRNLGLAIDDTLHNSNLGNDIYMDTSLHRNTLGPELLLANSNRYQPPLDDSNSGEDSESQGGDSIAFIEQTKARFRQLEREAEVRGGKGALLLSFMRPMRGSGS